MKSRPCEAGWQPTIDTWIALVTLTACLLGGCNGPDAVGILESPDGSGSDGAWDVGSDSSAAPDAEDDAADGSAEDSADSVSDAAADTTDASSLDAADATLSAGDATLNAGDATLNAGDASADSLDAGDASADDAAAAEGGSSDAGPRLVKAGTGLIIEGITDDHTIIYFDNSNQTYYAVSADGGAPQALTTVDAGLTGFTWIFGNEVFLFSTNSHYMGNLYAWRPGATMPYLLTAAGIVRYTPTAWASPDGAYTAYVLGAADGTTGTLYGANGDGSAPTALLTNIDMSTRSADGPCLPRVAFTAGSLVVSYCTVGDAGTTPALAAFSVSGWAKTLDVPQIALVNQVSVNPYLTGPFVVDPAGDRIVAVPLAGDAGAGPLAAFDLSGDSGGILDPNASLDGTGVLVTSSSAPWSVLYAGGGTLRETPVTVPAPEVLADGGVTAISSTTLDGQWALTASVLGSDIGLVSTTTPGPVTPVAASRDYHNLLIAPEALPHAGFTADGTYVLYRTDWANSVPGTPYYVRAAPVASPQQSQLLSRGYALDIIPLKDSQVLLYDNFQMGDSSTFSTVDVSWIDLATSAPTTVLAAAVPLERSYLPLATGGIAVSNDHTLLVYPVITGSSPGIYVAPLP